jgi:hypothetical protein
MPNEENTLQPTKELPQYLNKAQLNFISQKTPEQFIKPDPAPEEWL